MVSAADLMPASSPSVLSVSVTRYPLGWPSAYRLYIRSSISAQSCASTFITSLSS